MQQRLMPQPNEPYTLTVLHLDNTITKHTFTSPYAIDLHADAIFKQYSADGISLNYQRNQKIAELYITRSIA